jgi:starch-binding outer membrane protein, SusD/RagB family
MKTIFKSIIPVLVLTLSACSDFLEKEPHALVPETYFNNESELQTFLNGVYSPLMQEVMYGGNYYFWNTNDDLGFYQRTNPTSSILCANANSSNIYITQYWRALYDGINRANMFMENADRNPDVSEKFRKTKKAEALFLRSFYYFHLVQGWGDVPFRLNATASVNNLDAPRVDREIIYDQMIKDIVEAIPNLPASNTLSYTGHVTQSAAKGILARIYLFRAGEHHRMKKAPDAEKVRSYYAEAKRWALEVKESSIHGLVTPYSQVFMDLIQDKYNSTGVHESIWEIELYGNLTSQIRASGRLGNTVGFGASVDHSAIESIRDLAGMQNPGYSYKFVYATLKLYEMYESEGDRERGDWNIVPYEYVFAAANPRPVTGRKYYFGKKPADMTTIEGMPVTEETEAISNRTKTRCLGKYRREHELLLPKNKNYNGTNFPVLRYSDILLMIAEADNELTASPSALAYECIDAVRIRAGITKLEGSGLTKELFREAIKKERAMEFCFEGTRRWDLIRWGDFVNNMTDMANYITKEGWVTGMRYAANYFMVTDTYHYFPIPDSELSINKAITENNPGW